MKSLSVLIALALLSGSAFAADNCVEHQLADFSDEDQQLVQEALQLEYCANALRLVDNRYRDGWLLHQEASRRINQIDCDCSYHGHDNAVAFAAYNLVVKDINSGMKMADDFLSYCEDELLAIEKGAE